MPRIAKWKEKYECVKNLAPRPVRFYFDDSSNELKTHTLYDLIEEVIADLLPKHNDEWFNKFVEAKKLDDYINF
jgi:hypothetical protein